MCVYWQWSAPFDNAAQRRGAAGLDGLHQAMLVQGQFMRLPVRGAVLPEDVASSRAGCGMAAQREIGVWP